MKRQPSGGKRTLPKGLKKPQNVPGLRPAVIGGIEGGRLCERCGKTVPPEEMTAGGRNCQECGHHNHHQELGKREQQEARVRRQLLKLARDWRVENGDLEELCDKVAELHGGVAELAK